MIDARAYLLEQEPALKNFVQKHIKAEGASIKPLAQDWASRRYFRVDTGDKSFVLMQTVPDHIKTATMGHKLSAFVRVNTLLNERGIRAPKIMEIEEQSGFVLLEDFGDITLGSALEKSADTKEIYTRATDVLIKLRNSIFLDDLCHFPKYKDSYIYRGKCRIVDWYIPATRHEKNSDDLRSSYDAAWEAVTAQLKPPVIGFMHGDFHLQNLMMLKDGDVGVLDFQDAMAGPVPYDLGNLLENIRTDVPEGIYREMIERYGMDGEMHAWFRVMATQFHCRLLGQVLRLAILSGKTDLMRYIPRMQRYLISALKDPVLDPLARWMADEKVDFTARDFDIEKIRNFIRDDAF